MFGNGFAGAKQLWSASDGLLGQHNGSTPLGVSLTSLHHGWMRETEGQQLTKELIAKTLWLLLSTVLQ